MKTITVNFTVLNENNRFCVCHFKKIHFVEPKKEGGAYIGRNTAYVLK